MVIFLKGTPNTLCIPQIKHLYYSIFLDICHHSTSYIYENLIFNKIVSFYMGRPIQYAYAISNHLHFGDKCHYSILYTYEDLISNT